MVLEKYKEQIEYVAALTAFLMPIYLASEIYVVAKTKKSNYINTIKLLILSAIVFFAYQYLTPIQRYYAVGMILAIVFAFSVALGIAKIFKLRP